MKKTLALLALVLICSFNTLLAQPPAGGGGGQMDPARMLEMMKERIKPQLIEKTKLSDAQADKVLEIQVASQGQMRGFRDLSDEERATKMKEMNEARAKKYKEIPLTDDQIKSVTDFFEELRKNRGARPGGGR